jgi:hypothetical protein
VTRIGSGVLSWRRICPDARVARDCTAVRRSNNGWQVRPGACEARHGALWQVRGYAYKVSESYQVANGAAAETMRDDRGVQRRDVDMIQRRRVA